MFIDRCLFLGPTFFKEHLRWLLLITQKIIVAPYYTNLYPVLLVICFSCKVTRAISTNPNLLSNPTDKNTK